MYLFLFIINYLQFNLKTIYQFNLIIIFKQTSNSNIYIFMLLIFLYDPNSNFNLLFNYDFYN